MSYLAYIFHLRLLRPSKRPRTQSSQDKTPNHMLNSELIIFHECSMSCNVNVITERQNVITGSCINVHFQGTLNQTGSDTSRKHRLLILQQAHATSESTATECALVNIFGRFIGEMIYNQGSFREIFPLRKTDKYCFRSTGPFHDSFRPFLANLCCTALSRRPD